MISNKDDIIFDLWSHTYLTEPYNEHNNRTLELVQEMIVYDGEFVLCFKTYDSILLRTLYDY